MVTPYFYPHIGGVENYVYNIGKGLREEYKWEIIVVTSSVGKRVRKVEIIGGIKIYRLPFWFKISNTPVNLLWLFSIRKILREELPDIVNVHSPVPFISDVTSLVVGKIPLVTTYHSIGMLKRSSIWNPLIFLYELLFLPILFKKSKKIICCSPVLIRKNLKKYKDKASYITPGVDTNIFKSSKEKSTNDVLYVGRMEEDSDLKGISFLFEAISIVKLIKPDISLRLVGSGDKVEYYKMYAQKLDIIKNVEFIGSKINNELVLEYQRSKVLVLPSITEGESFGIVLIEAMACKKPVIGSDIGGIPYVIDNNSNGILVTPKDSQALADAIMKILKNSKSAKKMGENGYKKVEKNFTWDKQIKKTKDLMENIC
jgi:glycosyltransferase involved in cell wall biosynthesis